MYIDRQVRVDVKSDAGSHIATFLPHAYDLIIPYRNLSIPEFDTFRKRLIGMNELTKGHNYDSWFNAAIRFYEKKVKYNSNNSALTAPSSLTSPLPPPPTTTPTTYTPNNDDDIENIILSLLTSWYALYIVQSSNSSVAEGVGGGGSGVGGGGGGGSAGSSGAGRGDGSGGVGGEVKLAGICRKGVNEEKVLITVLIDMNR